MFTEIRLEGLKQKLDLQGLEVGAPLRGLGPIVVLAGPNGGGKSRFLRVIQSLDETMTIFSQLLPEYTLEQIREGASKAAQDPTSREPLRAANANTARMADEFASTRWSADGDGHPLPVPKVISLSLDRSASILNADKMTDTDRKTYVLASGNPGLVSAYQGQHAYLSAMARHLMLGEIPSTAATPKHLQQLQVATAFRDIVDVLVGARLHWQMDDGGSIVPVLFGRPYVENELSEGQKVLLAWSIVLHCQRDKLANAIVLIDEPENHLHPDACVQALSRLSKDVLGANGQIWLATHSIPLIAWAGIDSLYAVRDGRIEYAGNRVAELVASLAGGKDATSKVVTLLSDAELIGFLHFVVQCLAEPSAVAFQDNDPQMRGLADLMEDIFKDRTIVELLDYGAGRARLATALAKAFSDKPDVLRRLKYIAYDPFSKHQRERESSVRMLEAAGARAASITDIRKIQLDGARVDLVVLCNVLHEIPPSAWGQTFADCRDALKEDGSLVVIEDQAPPVGELPHEKGFIVLDYIEIQAMFGKSGSVEDLSARVPEAYHGRVSIFRVTRDALAGYSDEHLQRALGFVTKRARDQVEKLRSDTLSLKEQQSGRLHALYAMLWMNAELARRPQ
jgi:energy-coupling factor transporter ATP-binding protein EcfA2